MKRIGMLCLTLVLLMSILPREVSAAAEIITGKHGDNITWTFDASTGEMTFSGTGEIESEEWGVYPWPWVDYPWYEFHALVKKLTIGEGIVNIPMCAFRDFDALTAVNLPESLEWIAENAFNGCSSLKEVTLPEGLVRIDHFAFAFCEALREVRLPEKMNEIPQGMFWGCTGLERIELPSGIRVIGKDAFGDCVSLRSLTLPRGLERIGERAFSHCVHLTRVDFTWGTLQVDSTAFLNCPALLGIKWYSWYRNGILGTTLVLAGVVAALCFLWLRSGNAGRKRFGFGAAAIVIVWFVYMLRALGGSLEPELRWGLYQWASRQQSPWSAWLTAAMEYLAEGALLATAIFGVGVYRYYLTGEWLRRCDSLIWGEGFVRGLVWLEGMGTTALWLLLACRYGGLFSDASMLALWPGNLMGLLAVLYARRSGTREEAE